MTEDRSTVGNIEVKSPLEVLTTAATPRELVNELRKHQASLVFPPPITTITDKGLNINFFPKGSQTQLEIATRNQGPIELTYDNRACDLGGLLEILKGEGLHLAIAVSHLNPGLACRLPPRPPAIPGSSREETVDLEPSFVFSSTSPEEPQPAIHEGRGYRAVEIEDADQIDKIAYQLNGIIPTNTEKAEVKGGMTLTLAAVKPGETERVVNDKQPDFNIRLARFNLQNPKEALPSDQGFITIEKQLPPSF